MAVLFDDASSQYMTITSVPVSSLPLSVSAWFYTDDVSITEVGVSFTWAATSSNYYSYLGVHGTVAGDPVVWRFKNGGSLSNADTTTGVTVNTWHHAFASQTTTGASVLIDGGSSGSNSTSVTASLSNFDTTNISGWIFNSSPDSYWSGRISEVGIWNVALSANEVAGLAKGLSPLAVRPASLVFYVPGARIKNKDYVGGLSFTEVNSPTVDAHPRVFYIPRPFYTVPVAAVGGEPVSMSIDPSDTSQWVPGVKIY